MPQSILLIGLLLLVVACQASATAGPAAYTFAIADAFSSSSYILLDPKTLDDLPGAKERPAAMFSADGSTGIVVEATAGRANPDPQTVVVIVIDRPGGGERTRFHPPQAGMPSGLSANGRRLLWQSLPFPVGVYPPPVDWYVLETTDGAVAGRVYDEDNACFRQSANLAPDGERLYCLVDPALDEASGPQPARVVAYEVGSSGRPAAEVYLETRIGQRPTAGGTVWELLEPALALSPDGRRLAVVHAESDRITLVNAQDMTVENTITLSPAVDVWDWLGLAARKAKAKGEIEGVIRYATFSADSRQLYIFSQVHLPNGDESPAERGLWRVDLSRGQVAARALGKYQIQWLLPAPDGTLFAFGTSDAELHPHEIRETSPTTLWRLDGQTLRILAARDFTGYRAGQLTAGSP